ncbi:MAG: RraA family protein [Chloroflexota bacterium]
MTVNAHPKPIAADVIEAYKQILPATLGHYVDDGFADTRIRPVFKRIRAVGTAVTLKLPERDLTMTRPALAMLQPGDVLIIDQGGESLWACWGEMTSLAAQLSGCVGVIIDGAVCDVVEIEDQAMPTWSRHISAAVGRRGSGEGGGVNIPVQCGGVSVHPGDLVVADDNGILIIPPRHVGDYIERGLAAEARGPLVKRWLESGGSLAEITGKSVAELEEMLAARG